MFVNIGSILFIDAKSGSEPNVAVYNMNSALGYVSTPLISCLSFVSSDDTYG